MVVSCAAIGQSASPVVPTPEDEFSGLLPVDGHTAASSAVPNEPGADEQTPIATPIADLERVDESDPLYCLSRRQRVAQLLLPLLLQSELDQALAYAAAGDLGAIGLLQPADFSTPDQRLGDKLAALQQASFVPVLVASDEEGGSVQRLANLLGDLPSASSNAQTRTADEVRAQFETYGAGAHDLGVDIIFGPVLDVGSAPGIASRSFGDDPALVASYGRAVAEGLLAAGVTPVFKHFPGHGRATADSHLTLPTTPSLAELRTTDLVPYELILGDPQFSSRVAVMIGHLSVPGLSGDTPASLSSIAIEGLLRQELGFQGLVFTDAMNMGAIVNTYGALDAIELSIRAGSDIVILGGINDLEPAIDHLVAAMVNDPVLASTIDNRALRVLTVKGQGAICAGAE